MKFKLLAEAIRVERSPPDHGSLSPMGQSRRMTKEATLNAVADNIAANLGFDRSAFMAATMKDFT